MVFAVAAQQPSRAIRGGSPGDAAIRGTANKDVAVVLVRSEQVERAALGEQGGPEGPVNGRDPFPARATVSGLKDVGHSAAVFGAFSSKFVVGGNVITVGQNGRAGRIPGPGFGRYAGRLVQLAGELSRRRDHCVGRSRSCCRMAPPW